MAAQAAILGAPSQPLPELSFASLAAVCRKHDIAWARFGREAIRDPRLIFDMQSGRELRSATAKRVTAYVASLEGC